MAIVNGKCPQCGAVTKVNETKETAFCTQCGNQINVQQSIYLLKAAERARPDHAQAGQTNHTRTTTSQRRENRERAAEKQVMEAETRQKVSDWLQMCSTEQDFLMLRKRILDMALSEREKGMLFVSSGRNDEAEVEGHSEKGRRLQKQPGIACDRNHRCYRYRSHWLGYQLFLFHEVAGHRVHDPCCPCAYRLYLGSF